MARQKRSAIETVVRDVRDKKKNEQARVQCEANGGKWDAENGECIMPEKKEEPKPAAKLTPVTPSTPETFRDEAGEISGITIDGKTFFGSPEEIKLIAAKKLGKTAQPAGTAPVGTAEAQAKLRAAVGQIGQIGPLTEAVEAPINIGQAVTAGGARILPAAAGGAAVGAAAGLLGGPLAPVTSSVGAIALGAAGAAGGFVSGVLSNIKEQQRGELQAADVELKNARTNMRQLSMLASQDPANAEVYIQQYNQQLTRVHQSRRQTQVEVQGNLNSFMEDGREQLADFDSFLQPGGIADIYGQKLRVSLSTGVPLTEADFLTDFEELA